jgi:hypothetical protein
MKKSILPLTRRAKTAGKGFKLLVPDATLTYRLLDGWNAEGKGNLPILKEVTTNETIASLEKKQELRDFNFRLHFVDDLAYHNRGGNVHCATNVSRAFY